MVKHKVATREEWLAARNQLLAKEKELTRRGDQVIEVLRPYGGNFRAEDEEENSYSLSGKGTYFYVAYWSPRLYREENAPPAVGAMCSRPQHHWDLNAGISAAHAPRELCLKVGEATLALARESGGVALDMLGFPISRADDLLPP